MTPDRLNWTAQNYIRSATHTAAVTRLFDFHADLDLARGSWGGDMASAAGTRFVIPVSTIHAGYNPRYFGRQRGSTLYTWMADTHASFHQMLIPGTQRDSLFALDGLMANQTVLRPKTVSTDTAGLRRSSSPWPGRPAERRGVACDPFGPGDLPRATVEP